MVEFGDNLLKSERFCIELSSVFCWAVRYTCDVGRGTIRKFTNTERGNVPYPSVDQLQKALRKDVFHYAQDSKKAAGRALGTLVEIITFYALKSWGFERSIANERPLPEFANDDITHNVEYSLHPSVELTKLTFADSDLPLTSTKMVNALRGANIAIPEGQCKVNRLLTKDMILRNSCTIFDAGETFINAYLDFYNRHNGSYSVCALHRRAFAIFECKRVGVEEGMRKGPQTIEKAKQGAYVARTVSALQKVRRSSGTMGGFIEWENGTHRFGDYYELMAEVIISTDRELLRKFILTVGIVSNHGNWFTAENHNKEIRVLAQSYDWLLFLQDAGLAQFVDEILLNPKAEHIAARDAFRASYTGEKNVNQFTKVQIALAADAALQSYFATKSKEVESWFNIIAPEGKPLSVLKDELIALSQKNWVEIHA